MPFTIISKDKKEMQKDLQIFDRLKKLYTK